MYAADKHRIISSVAFNDISWHHQITLMVSDFSQSNSYTQPYSFFNFPHVSQQGIYCLLPVFVTMLSCL